MFKDLFTERKSPIIMYADGEEVYRGSDANKVQELMNSREYYGIKKRVEQDFEDITINFDSSYKK